MGACFAKWRSRLCLMSLTTDYDLLVQLCLWHSLSLAKEIKGKGKIFQVRIPKGQQWGSCGLKRTSVSAVRTVHLLPWKPKRCVVAACSGQPPLMNHPAPGSLPWRGWKMEWIQRDLGSSLQCDNPVYYFKSSRNSEGAGRTSPYCRILPASLWR